MCSRARGVLAFRHRFTDCCDAFVIPRQDADGDTRGLPGSALALAVIRDSIFAGLRLSGVPWLLRETVQRRRTTILVYHDPSPRMLEDHLRALGTRYNFVSLADYVSSRTGGSAQLPPKSLVITLDDGHVGNHELRGVFEHFHVTPTIFVCTGLIGTRRGFWFLHTSDVETLKRLPNDERVATLTASGFSPDAELPRREALSNDEIGSSRPSPTSNRTR